MWQNAQVGRSGGRSSATRRPRRLEKPSEGNGQEGERRIQGLSGEPVFIVPSLVESMTYRVACSKYEMRSSRSALSAVPGRAFCRREHPCADRSDTHRAYRRPRRWRRCALPKSSCNSAKCQRDGRTGRAGSAPLYSARRPPPYANAAAAPEKPRAPLGYRPPLAPTDWSLVGARLGRPARSV